MSTHWKISFFLETIIVKDIRSKKFQLYKFISDFKIKKLFYFINIVYYKIQDVFFIIISLNLET